ncbi:MAG TPA: zinc-binding alcohol dehydrogenase, partial [Chloroflexota bacterium]|nr:zinc-binding alcohol dehydrogenase [Chloroflexota bacterium]
MKQVVQELNQRVPSVKDVPPPQLRPQGVLVRTAASLVSAGTERTLVDFARKNLVEKARARPDLVRQAVDKAQREGWISTIEGVRNRMAQPVTLGYSSAGLVSEVGSEVGHLKCGDRVACGGGGYASHAEVAYVPRTLVVRLPNSVSFEAGAFATLGAVAMQGVRQAGVSVGESVSVIGLGLLGQLTVQILKAAGCRVLAIDPDGNRCALAGEVGADVTASPGDAAERSDKITGGHGFDSVIITAGSQSNEPVVLAGELSRDRGIVVAVGAVDLQIPRKVYYEK